MSISRKEFISVIDRIASENGLTSDSIWSQIGDLVKPSSPFASKAAKELAQEKNIDTNKIKGTGNLGKITSDDIRKFLGKPVKNKQPTQWSSKAAKKLAEENSLTVDDFPIDKRTGRKWKNGTVTISVDDVKLKAGLSSPKKKSPYASKAAKVLAKENGIKAKDLDGTGKGDKITKKDILKYLKTLSNEESSSSSSSDEEE